jgi:hypothetical protein
MLEQIEQKEKIKFLLEGHRTERMKQEMTEKVKSAMLQRNSIENLKRREHQALQD